MTLHIAPSYVSPELEQAAASTRTEESARAEITATRAQSAFLTVVRAASEMTTERLLFEARSVAHDLTERDDLSRMEYLERLIAECKRLTKGDELKARILASAVLFGE